ncbi:hypothetical protein [Microbacterium algeriense]|uniref:DUF4190 domain-containing protein n=1 Tax=Microbacterium algeriense TaxID=2615184 RepID=A0ABQ6V7Y7_9MICO|nr:hypothetical protein [Microbacterium algeriense]KAB1866381.1 hypothetical protein F6A08_00670 [Microbacterium algeriense]MDX2398793.1 hypothetical protein [Microbacterium algeriense]
MPQTKTRPTAAWILGLSLASIALAVATPWAILFQVALFAIAVSHLTQKPARRDRTLLLLACGAITVSLIWVIATGLMIYAFRGDVDVTSVPLPS